MKVSVHNVQTKKLVLTAKYRATSSALLSFLPHTASKPSRLLLRHKHAFCQSPTAANRSPAWIGQWIRGVGRKSVVKRRGSEKND